MEKFFHNISGNLSMLMNSAYIALFKSHLDLPILEWNVLGYRQNECVCLCIQFPLDKNRRIRKPVYIFEGTILLDCLRGCLQD